MSVSLLVKSKYKWTDRDYMTLKQFATYVKTGERPAWTRWDFKQKSVAKYRKTIIRK